MKKNKRSFLKCFALILFIFLSSAVFASDNPLKVNPNPCRQQPNQHCGKDCINKIQEMVDTFRKESDIPGMQLSLNFFKQPLQVYCSGSTTMEGQDPITPKTKFTIASTTKSYTAAIVLQLVQEGKLSLGDKLGKWFGSGPKGEYPQWSENTVFQLLHMTSNIGDYFDGDNGRFQKVYESDPTHNWSLKELCDYVYNGNTLCKRVDANSRFCAEKPGEGWMYSNTNYLLLERIIEKVTQKSLKDLIYSRIFKPLKLSDSVFLPDENPATIKNISHAYNNDPKGLFYLKDVIHFSLSAARGAGAVVCTTGDLAKWIESLFGGKMFNEKYMKKYMKEVVCVKDSEECKAGEIAPDESKTPAYGYGMMRLYDEKTKNTIWFHPGGSEGMGTLFMYDPKNNFTLSYSMNKTPLANARNFQSEVYAYIVSQLKK